MWKCSLAWGLFLFAAVSVYWAPWIYDDDFSGNSFARNLIEEASKQNGSVYVGDPANLKTRICFSPGDRSTGLFRSFPDQPVVYREDDDSNKWYIARFDSKMGGVMILAVDQRVLEWNDFSSADSIKLSSEELRERTDPEARIVCTSRIFVKYLGGDDSPLFRPDYATAGKAE